ncbi:MAG: AMP-dependent synthetase/ligase [Streptosporangiaceae bacterium]|jgi:long-chain acyl-CoA synthetase
MREFGIPALVEVPASASLTDAVFRRAAAEPGMVVMRRRDRAGIWQDVTATKFCAEVSALARGLMAAGIGPGDRVALMSRSRYEWTLIDYASWAAGAVTVPVYETSSAEQVEWILGDSSARAVFAETSAHAQTISSVRSGLPALEHLWMTGALDGLAAGGEQISADRFEQHRTARRAVDLASIVYTSGTTGRPKGCGLTHGNLLADVCNAVGALPEIFETPGCSTLLFLPLAHAFARIVEVGCLEPAAVLGHWPDMSTLADGLAEFRPTFLAGVPRLFEKTYNSAQQQASASKAMARTFTAAAAAAVAWSKAHDDEAAGPGAGLALRHALFERLVYRRLRSALGGRLQYAISGGAPLGERLGHFFRGAGITVLEGYGLTEATGAATMNRPARNKIGTVGQPLPGVTISIASDGEILIKGPNVFPGYWRNDAATAEALDSGGWLHTGDVGALDGEGFLRVTGRKKELIVTAGGTNVAPAVLEDRLRANPLVSQATVVGNGQPYVGCLVTLDPDALTCWKQRHRRSADGVPGDLADDPELIAEIQLAVDEANRAVSRAESIRRFAILGTDFTEASGELTPSLKVRRNVVARNFAAEIEALYSLTT